jgi:hypothetical protein
VKRKIKEVIKEEKEEKDSLFNEIKLNLKLQWNI